MGNQVFVSTLTGVSLREAAFAKLPAISYDIAFFKGLLRHECNALLAPVHGVATLADQVERLQREPELRQRLAEQLHDDIRARWNPAMIRSTLAEVFPAADRGVEKRALAGRYDGAQSS